MITYTLQRFMYMIVLLLSVTTFVIIQLPPGNYLTMYITRLEASVDMWDPPSGPVTKSIPAATPN